MEPWHHSGRAGIKELRPAPPGTCDVPLRLLESSRDGSQLPQCPRPRGCKASGDTVPILLGTIRLALVGALPNHRGSPVPGHSAWYGVPDCASLPYNPHVKGLPEFGATGSAWFLIPSARWLRRPECPQAASKRYESCSKIKKSSQTGELSALCSVESCESERF